MQKSDLSGLYAGLFCYAFWGVAPIYFKYLQHIPPLAVVAHRVVWASAILALFLILRDGSDILKKIRIRPKQILVLAFSGALVMSNWLIFVWAVSNEQILATSLGYFITPLISVLLGLLFLNEKLKGMQVVAVGLAICMTLYLALFIGEPPWVALALAFSFGLYGLIRKRLQVGPMIGLMWETLLVLPFAVAYLLMRTPTENTASFSNNITLTLLIGSGLVTLLPLISFNFAAKRMTLASMGFLQYLAPSISFCIAIFVYHEPFSSQKLIAFCGIWLALIIYTSASIHNGSKMRAQAASE